VLVYYSAENGPAAHEAEERAERAEVSAPKAAFYPRDGDDAYEHQQNDYLQTVDEAVVEHQSTREEFGHRIHAAAQRWSQVEQIPG
jgi:hypothetical protein